MPQLSAETQSATTELQPEQLIVLYSSLLALGNIFELDFSVSVRDVESQLAPFADQWVHYNPSKPGNPRKGLSVTSLDGGLSGIPDLDSLKEYNEKHGTRHSDEDFRALTPVYRECRAIHPLIEHFLPHVGRTHFLRFGAGGHFPPHRDGAAISAPEAFRILVPLYRARSNSYAFLYDKNWVQLEEGRAYFVNTLVSHAIFSFRNDVTILVCNIVLNEDSVARLRRKLQSY